MKSPQISTVIIALVFAIIAFIITSTISNSSVVVSLIVFISAFIAPLLSSSSNNASSTNNTSVPAQKSSEDVKTLYVGNLPYRANETAIRELFSNHGIVQSVRLMKDKHTGKRRGFGFVEMATSDIDKAISALNDTEFQQRTLKVREAKERPERTEPID
ncbi:RNA recognition motif domain-containing protein [Candidatus Colwellia aromaticivorans]|uniref:RNA recognition motif domain-containing protein n=1 Tax=Candidatus Colwellia aromaticivorans TaxID=2267621 RepID=UPI000DF32D52|nr:RNA-binding protein [Candidatus Colwellia aromaticivorans]